MKIILFTRCAYLGNASCPVAVITIFIVAVILRSLSMDLRRPTAQLLEEMGWSTHVNLGAKLEKLQMIE